VLTTFVIGLREGLEAALIVGIIAAFLVSNGDRRSLRRMWWGVGAAIGLSAGVAIGLHLAGRAMSFRAREIMEGILAIVAAAGITYMIVWMRRHSAGLRTDLESKTGEALAIGSATALAGMAFVAVIREGLETAIFLLAALNTTDSPAQGALGAAVGIVASVALGYGIYRGGIRLDLGRFFRVTGVVLVVVAAGLVTTGVHDLAEAGVIDLLQRPMLDLTWLLGPGTVRSSLLTAFLGIQPVPTFAEVLAWTAFLVPMVIYVTRPAQIRRTPAGA
jgi:high-affinity iron transporter